MRTQAAYANNGQNVVIEEYSIKEALTAKKKLSNERPEGTWTFWEENGKNLLRIENYEKGKLHGLQTSFEKGRKTAEVNYKNGRKSGPALEFFPTEKIKVQQHFELDRLHGEFIKYHKNGQVEYQGNYIRNKRNGTWKYYDKKGALTEERTYKMGEEQKTAQ